MNSKLHAITDGLGRPLLLWLIAGQVSDHKSARHFLERLPEARELPADRDYDADWFRNPYRGNLLLLARLMSSEPGQRS